VAPKPDCFCSWSSPVVVGKDRSPPLSAGQAKLTRLVYRPRRGSPVTPEYGCGAAPRRERAPSSEAEGIVAGAVGARCGYGTQLRERSRTRY
jgi:hypothetical protein